MGRPAGRGVARAEAVGGAGAESRRRSRRAGLPVTETGSVSSLVGGGCGRGTARRVELTKAEVKEFEMAVTVLIPTALRQFAGGEAEVVVEARTVGEALDLVMSRHAELRTHLYNEQNALRSFVNVYVGD